MGNRRSGNYQVSKKRGVGDGKSKEWLTGYCSWTDAEGWQGCFFWEGRERKYFRQIGMWQKASRGTVSSVE